MRVLLSGYYGFGNLGDESLLEVIAARMHARFPAVRLDVLSATPEVTAQRLDIEATPRWQPVAIRHAIERADVVVSGGGGLLQSATSLRSLLYYAGVVRAAVRARKKTMIFAQSIGPLDSIGRVVVQRFCHGVDRATVRDERSLSLLSTLLPHARVERTADPVFLGESTSPADLSVEGLGSQPYAIVSVRRCPGFDAGIKTIARAVDRLAAKHHVRAAFLPLGGVEDAGASTAVIRACESAPMLLPQPAVEKVAAIVAQAHAVIGMRLHALIFAASASVPFLAIPYDPKVQSLLDDFAYPLAPLWTPREQIPEEGRVDALIDDLIVRRDGLRAHLAAALPGVRARAERNFDVLGELLEES
jgi:polysaccharide pyruvyl transferase CsaB